MFEDEISCVQKGNLILKHVSDNFTAATKNKVVLFKIYQVYIQNVKLYSCNLYAIIFVNYNLVFFLLRLPGAEIQHRGRGVQRVVQQLAGDVEVLQQHVSANQIEGYRFRTT